MVYTSIEILAYYPVDTRPVSLCSAPCMYQFLLSILRNIPGTWNEKLPASSKARGPHLAKLHHSTGAALPRELRPASTPGSRSVTSYRPGPGPTRFRMLPTAESAPTWNPVKHVLQHHRAMASPTRRPARRAHPLPMPGGPYGAPTPPRRTRSGRPGPARVHPPPSGDCSVTAQLGT